MKKIIISILYVTGLMLVACNPMKDINDVLDAKVPAYKQSINDVLTTADYEAMGGDVAKNHAFSASDPAAVYVPEFLKSKYPGLTSGSVDKVTYNFTNGSKAYLSDLESATAYTLSKDDYNSMGDSVANHQCFSPAYPPADFVPDFLAAKYSSAEDGSLRLLSYQYAPTEPKVGANIYSETFDNTLGNFTVYDVSGAQTWVASSYGAKMSGYSSGAQANEDWLVSPQIDLTGTDGPTFQISQAINYLNDQWDQIKVLISTDFSGDVTTATWTEITINNLPAGNNWNFVKSEKIDLSSYVGEKINIAFKYVSTTSNAATWEINLFTIDNATTSDAYTENVMYQLNSGKWAPMKGVYALSSADYVPMGGSVGKYGDFSSSDPADNYLPQFLTQKYPYAQEGDTVAVMYKYYSSGLKTYADEYDFINGEWALYNPIEVKTDQFIMAPSNEWVFDPTVNYTMKSGIKTGDDYQLIVDYVFENYGASYIDVVYSGVNEGETYYGVNSYYGEFRPSSFDSKFATWQDACKEAMQLAFLPAKFPNAVSQVNGIDVNYQITFAVYSGTMINYVITFQCTKSAPNPEFTYVSGPDPAQ